MKYRKAIRKFSKVIGIALLAILLLLTALWIALQQPAFQSYLANKATQTLSKRLETLFRIDKIELQFFNRVLIKGLYVEDLKGDTLLYAGRLEARLSLFAPLRQRLTVKNIAMEDTYANLRRGTDSTFNFQFIIDEFSSAEPDTTQSESDWEFDINRIDVRRTRFSLADSLAQTELYLRVGDFTGKIKKLGLKEQALAIRSLDLRNSLCTYSSWAPPSEGEAPAEESTPMAFPFPGWTLQADDILLANNAFSFDDFSQPPGPSGYFDPSHIHLEDLALEMSDFSWTKEEMRTAVHHIALKELNGFEIESMAARLSMSPEGMEASQFEFRTPNSHLPPSEATLRYPGFDALGDFIRKVDVEVKLAPASLAIPDITYWSGQLPYIKTGYPEKIALRGHVSGKVNDINVHLLEASLGKAATVRLSGKMRGLPETERLTFQLQLQQLASSYTELMAATEGLALPAGLRQFGAIDAKGQISGKLDSLIANKLEIQTETYTAFRGQARAYGLPEVETTRFELDIEELASQAEDLAGFMEAPPSRQLAALGKMQYQGQFTGTIYDFRLGGTLHTEEGSLEQNVALKFNKAYSNASYSGKVQVRELGMGAILGDTATYGPATLSLEGSGSGLSIDSLSAQLSATVQSIVFRNYNYRDIQASGDFQRRQFNGQVNIDDEHLCFSFDGLVNLNDTLPEYRFTAVLDTAELAYLNLYPSTLRISSRIEAKLRGNHIDNLSGQAALRRLSVSDKTNRYYTDSITLDARRLSPSEKVLELQSDILKARLEGDYQVSELSGLVVEFIDGFFPAKQLLQPQNEADTILVAPRFASQDFRVEASLSRPTRLTRILLPALQKLDTASLSGFFKSEEKTLKLDAQVPALQYSGLLFDRIDIAIDGQPEHLNNRLSFRGLSSETQEILPGGKAEVRLFQDTLTFDIDIRDDTVRHPLALSGLMSAPDSLYQVRFNSPFVLNGNDWAIPPDNLIRLARNYINVQNFRLSRKQQEIYLQSQPNGGGGRFAPLEVGFRQFRLVEISRLVGFDEQFLSGGLYGKVLLSMPDTSFRYDADLEVRGLMLDSNLVGDLALLASPIPEQNEIELEARLAGENNQMMLSGRYGLNDGQLGFDVRAEKLQLALADIFAGGVIRDSRGTLSASLEIGGTADAPQVLGSLSVDSASSFVDYLQSRYLLPSHTINFRKGAIEVGKMELIDPNGQRATLSGRITHQHFHNIELALNFKAPSFQVLDTGPQDNELFYGKVLLSADASITGPLESPSIRVTTRTLPGTSLTALPLSEEKAIVREDFIVYGRPAAYRADTSLEVSRSYQAGATGYSLDLQLTLTPDAQLIAIIDPATGDKLTARGRSNLSVEIDESGELTTTGEIFISSGSYFFNYEGLVKRSFDIREGSTIYLPGDPLNARFDITAIYTARTSVYELIQSQSELQPEEARAARRRQPINVLLSLDGTLSQPQITFDIRLPDEASGPLTDAVTQKLAQIRESNSELNKQVLGLLLFNSFLLESGGNTSLASAGESFALSSVSSFISGQLNRLADKYVEGIDLNIGLESYKSQGQTTVTELDVGLSKQLFNDRLSVKIGGNVDVSDETTERENAIVTGDFVLEYKLTEDGRYRLRVFRRPDYDLLNQANATRTGIGIMYKKSFGGAKKLKRNQEK